MTPQRIKMAVLMCPLSKTGLIQVRVLCDHGAGCLFSKRSIVDALKEADNTWRNIVALYGVRPVEVELWTVIDTFEAIQQLDHGSTADLFNQLPSLATDTITVSHRGIIFETTTAGDTQQ